MAFKSKEVVAADKAQKTQLSLPDDLNLDELLKDAGTGVDDMSVDDVALPYIYILQQNSPVVNPGHSSYVEGAQASMFYNNVSGDIYEGRNIGVMFVPCAYERKIIEWIDRDKGGGWVADYDVDSDILKFTTKNDKGKLIMKATGNLIVETAYHYGLLHDTEENTWYQCVLPFKSTMLRQSRKWNNDLVTTKVPGHDVLAPRWLFPYHLVTVPETKANNSWWGIRLERLEHPVSGACYKQAKEFNRLVTEGLIKRAAESTTAGDVDEAVSAKAKGTGQQIDDNIPF